MDLSSPQLFPSRLGGKESLDKWHWPHYTDPLPISRAKFDDLQVLKRFCAIEAQQFFDNKEMSKRAMTQIQTSLPERIERILFMYAPLKRILIHVREMQIFLCHDYAMAPFFIF